MPNFNIKTPEWLRQMESILEELNEGVVDSLMTNFASFLPMKRWHDYGSTTVDELRGSALDAIFPPEDIPHIMPRCTNWGIATAGTAASSTFHVRTARESP